MAKPAEKSANGHIQSVAKNRKALFDYHVLEETEAGLVLTGSEVKALRAGKVQLLDAYVAVDRNELYLVHAHINEYENGAYANHTPTRSRKLLLHRREIDRLAQRVRERGLTIIPLEIYFKDGRAKVRIGLCKGKSDHDKRDTIRERDEKRYRDRTAEED